MSDIIQDDVIRIKLEEAYEREWFDICTVREVAEIRGGSLWQIVGMNEYKSLTPAHCVDYDKMSPETNAEIKRLSEIVMNSFPRSSILQRLASFFKK